MTSIFESFFLHPLCCLHSVIPSLQSLPCSAPAVLSPNLTSYFVFASGRGLTHIPQRLVCPPEGDTAIALPAPEKLPFPGVPVQMTSLGLWRETRNLMSTEGQKSEVTVMCKGAA